jgi:hypothetical protein
MFYAPAVIARKSPQKHRQPKVFIGLTEWMVFPIVTLAAVISAIVIGVQFYLAYLSVQVAAGTPLTLVERVVSGLDNNAIIVVFGWVAVPLLALCFGFAMAQGSLSSTALDYQLALVYSDLSNRGLRSFEAKLPPSVVALLNRFNDLLAQVQASTFVREAAARAAFALANAKATQPALAKKLDKAFGFQRLNAGLEEGSSVTGYTHTLTVRFAGTDGPDVSRPDRSDLALRLLIYGERIEVDRQIASLVLPASGDSEPLQLALRFKSEDGVLKVFSTGINTAEVLQEFRLTLTK